MIVGLIEVTPADARGVSDVFDVSELNKRSGVGGEANHESVEEFRSLAHFGI